MSIETRVQPVALLLGAVLGVLACGGMLQASEDDITEVLVEMAEDIAEADQDLAVAQAEHAAAIAEANEETIEDLSRLIRSSTPVHDQILVYRAILSLDQQHADARAFFQSIGTLDAVLAELNQQTDMLGNPVAADIPGATTHTPMHGVQTAVVPYDDLPTGFRLDDAVGSLRVVSATQHVNQQFLAEYLVDRHPRQSYIAGALEADFELATEQPVTCRGIVLVSFFPNVARNHRPVESGLLTINGTAGIPILRIATVDHEQEAMVIRFDRPVTIETLSAHLIGSQQYACLGEIYLVP